MNVFRILGDLSHLLAMILLLGKIWRSKCCTGISGKSQILFALVFTTRYLDLFTTFISIYNTVMKVVFLLCAYVTVYMIYGKFRKTFDSENDTFRLEFLLVPVIGLSFLENYSFTPLEILWTFSIYLESVAILPQLFMISKTGEAETITTHYLFFLGLYRALYLANWIRRYQTENFYDQIAVVSGVVQTIFYCDFFYLYVTKVKSQVCVLLMVPASNMEYKCSQETQSAVKKKTNRILYVVHYLQGSCLTWDKILGLGIEDTKIFQREQFTSLQSRTKRQIWLKSIHLEISRLIT
uniref:ER lumen protein-retaining receptor n=1 Tax=Sus scrofa TaxID=9823 RepID=A0A8D1CW83_PIG